MLDLLSAAPIEILCGERKLKVGALKLREFGLLQRFVRDHSIRPTVALREIQDLIAPEDRRQALKDALIADREWPPGIGSAAGNAVLFGDDEGQRLFLGVMLRKYQPSMTDAELDEIFAGISGEDFGALIQIAFGEDGLDPGEARAAARKRLDQFDAVPGSTSGSSTPTS